MARTLLLCHQQGQDRTKVTICLRTKALSGPRCSRCYLQWLVVPHSEWPQSLPYRFCRTRSMFATGESGAYAGIAIARAGTVMPLSTLECGGAYACHSNAPLAVGSELGRVTVSSLSWVQHK